MSEPNDLKARLMAQLEATIEQLIAQQPPSDKITLSDMERLVKQAGSEIEAQVLQALIEAHEATPDTERPLCPECQQPMHNKGKQRRKVVTEAGEIEVKRSYYYCEQCHVGFFPQDERWGITPSVYSVGCARQMVWLSGLLPFEQCAEVFERIGGMLIPASSIWRQTQQYGERLQARVEHERAQVKPERMQVGDAAHDHHQRKGVSMDGGMVNIRGEGWKEIKAGAVFDVDIRLERDPRTGELSDYAHGVNVTYTAVLGTVTEFAPALWALAVAHDVPSAAESSVTADGAEWIWTLVPDYFPDSVQIVDWYHATQHLAQAAHALYPDDDARAHTWYRQRLDDLFAGLIDRITRPLDQAGLTDQSRYFHVHQRRMQYHEFRENGYPIGSGTIESGIKQFKARLSAAGMRWSRRGAHRMLILRGAVLGHDFDRLWQLAA